MLNKIINFIEYNIMIVLSLFLLAALIIGRVDIIVSILICCMWFMFGYISFTKGVQCQMEDEIKELQQKYRQKIIKEYNKQQDEISNN
jgi:Ca2+/Na+ antiporter|tara:strand:- start:1307 stop:1570 length:264 start_codon:yes stop_codon:yes gene_type:complete